MARSNADVRCGNRDVVGVGIGLRTHTGVGERMFRALADAAINIQLINTSEMRMSAVIARRKATGVWQRCSRPLVWAAEPPSPRTWRIEQDSQRNRMIAGRLA